MTIVDEYGDIRIVKDDDGTHRMVTEDGDPIDYEEAPRRAQFLLDKKEAKRQGQLKLPL